MPTTGDEVEMIQIVVAPKTTWHGVTLVLNLRGRTIIPPPLLRKDGPPAVNDSAREVGRDRCDGLASCYDRVSEIQPILGKGVIPCRDEYSGRDGPYGYCL